MEHDLYKLYMGVSSLEQDGCDTALARVTLFLLARGTDHILYCTKFESLRTDFSNGYKLTLPEET
jgi:hypothetical protein